MQKKYIYVVRFVLVSLEVRTQTPHSLQVALHRGYTYRNPADLLTPKETKQRELTNIHVVTTHIYKNTQSK